ncbi:MAG: hypothetical protein QG572_944, partial [Pseudomonadota bacterium]|nr:hypothetical protein [Pseudomonadota bacterium]
NPRVRGSIPRLATSIPKGSRLSEGPLFWSLCQKRDCVITFSFVPDSILEAAIAK